MRPCNRQSRAELFVDAARIYANHPDNPIPQLRYPQLLMLFERSTTQVLKGE
jgi:hypothetical protein